MDDRFDKLRRSYENLMRYLEFDKLSECKIDKGGNIYDDFSLINKRKLLFINDAIVLNH